MGKWNYSIVDHDDESSGVGVNTVDLNSGNITAMLTLFDALRTAIDAIIIGTPRQESVSAIVTDIPGVIPADGFAQRETKWLVSGVDTNGLSATIEIPTANLDLLPGGTGVLNLAATEGLALKTALDAVWRSRNGLAVTTSKVIHVGRNI